MITGVLGYGYWGPNLVRNLNLFENTRVKMVADIKNEKLHSLKKLYPHIHVTTDPDIVLNDREIEAVVIATPVSMHFQLAQKALQKGKHVLLEKPMTSTLREAEMLAETAAAKNLTLMVDHTFLYNGVIHKLKDLIMKKELGNIQYIDSTRVNLGLFQTDINVMWDLASHDISIIHYLLNEKPYSVNAYGISHTNNSIENIAYILMNYRSGLIAHIHCSWSSPVKVRQMLIGGDKKMLIYNDIEPTEKIKIYDSGYRIKDDEHKQSILVDYRTGDIHIPKFETTEPLMLMVKDFYKAVTSGSEPVSGWREGTEVMRVLEAAQLSIQKRGQEVFI